MLSDDLFLQYLINKLGMLESKSSLNKQISAIKRHVFNLGEFNCTLMNALQQDQKVWDQDEAHI